jgi:hypothetical protein
MTLRTSTQSTKKKRLLTIPYTPELAGNVERLSQEMGIPLKVLRRWRRQPEQGEEVGWLSNPVTEQEFSTLLVIRNYVWAIEDLLRVQLSILSEPRRTKLCRTSDLSWIENIVYEDILRSYCLGKGKYLRIDSYVKRLRGRYPNGALQLTRSIFLKAKRAAYDRLRRAKAKGDEEYLRLLRSVNLDLDEAGQVIEFQRSHQEKRKASSPAHHLSDNQGLDPILESRGLAKHDAELAKLLLIEAYNRYLEKS